LVVSNSSPLVYLAELGDFELLPTLFQQIAIPRAVLHEVVTAGSRYPVAREVIAAQEKWMHVHTVQDVLQVGALVASGLDAGESEALVLARELSAEALLLDDSDAVRIAANLSVNVLRTPGIYRLAKERGLVSAIRPKLDDLRRAGFWLRDDHYRIILKSAGEPSD
jgi:predicted nucleic acid-binding protein